jgi:hypothetical protein
MAILAAPVESDFEFGRHHGQQIMTIRTAYIARFQRVRRPLLKLHGHILMAGNTEIIQILLYQISVPVSVNLMAGRTGQIRPGVRIIRYHGGLMRRNMTSPTNFSLRSLRQFRSSLDIFSRRIIQMPLPPGMTVKTGRYHRFPRYWDLRNLVWSVYQCGFYIIMATETIGLILRINAKRK